MTTIALVTITLIKDAEHDFYTPEGAITGDSGVAFLPKVDTGEARIELDTALAETGVFACWSGGVPSPTERTELNRELLNARQAGGDSRPFVQFFWLGAVPAGTPPVSPLKPAQVLWAMGSVIEAGTLDPMIDGVSELTGAHKIGFVDSSLSVDEAGLVFHPRNSGTKNKLILDSGPRRAIDDLCLSISGTWPATLAGAVQVPADQLETHRFTSATTRRSDTLMDDIFSGQYYEVFEDRRRPILGGGVAGEDDVTLAFMLDPLDMLNPERSHFVPSPDQGLLSGFRTTHGQKVLVRVPPDPAMSGILTPPRFSYVRQRADRDHLDGPRYENVNLLLEGDLLLEFLHDDGTAFSQGDSATVGRKSDARVGLLIGDTPHEYLELPEVAARTSALPVLCLRRGAGHIGPEGAAGAVKLHALNTHDDQMTWASLRLGGDGGAVVSEARNVRRLLTEDNGFADARHDPFRLVRIGGGAAHAPEGFVPVFPLGEAALRSTDDDTPVAALASAERRKLLTVARSSRLRASDGGGVKTTPLGFDIVENADGQVTKIILATTREQTDNGALSGELAIGAKVVGEPLLPEVLNGLVRNQLFMMINSSAPADNPTDSAIQLKGSLSLSLWKFQVDLSQNWERAQQYRDSVSTSKVPPPMVIVKGFEGLSIIELIGKENEKLWSSKRFLRAAAGDTRSPADQARAQVIAARDMAFRKTNGKLDPIYAELRKALEDRAWNGVLILDMELDIGALPAQIKGLTSGINLDNLRAQHLGIPVRRLSADQERPANMPFAVIDYLADEREITYLPDNELSTGKFEGPVQAENESDERFAMRVASLRVGFGNGRLQQFQCEIDLKLGAFFHDMGIEVTKDENAVITREADNNIRLVGSFERRIVNGRPVEIYSFLTKSVFNIKFSETFPLIESATISRIGFVSKETKGTGGADLVESSFLIDGDLVFRKIGDIDFFDVDKVTIKGLALDLRFKLNPAGLISIPKFRFNPGALIFDFDNSKLKNPSNRGFFGSLPIKFRGFGWLGKDLKLPELGYFNLGLSSGTGANAPFLLKFDLDLGGLGSFGSALEDFKMELGLVFGLNKGDVPHFDLGFKFAGSGGKDLSIGLQGVLEFTCKRYDIVSLKAKTKAGDEVSYFGFRGNDARLIVFGNEIPPKDEQKVGIYLFVAPENLGQSNGVGWLLASTNVFESGALDVKNITLGQRIDPLPGLQELTERLTTEVVVGQLANLVKGVKDENGKHTIPDVTFAPDRGWTIGFDAKVYGFIGLGFAMRDPDLAGVLLEVEAKSTTLFKIDVLYRKLTDDLGVYSSEITLPPSLRNWQFGAAGITIPIIGFEIFTNGDWGIDLGFPYGKDFSRSFAISVLPFVGAGGFYFRRISGPGARLLTARPRVRGAGDELLAYDPIVETGIGFRVGLGITLAQGILNAGVSLTIYSYMEGAYGRLSNPGGKPTDAARTYIIFSGTIGIMGELYGYVDFGIIKAGLFVQVWIETGFKFETDRAFVIFLRVGVSVRVRVVIASFKVFGKRIEIAISFSFNAVLPISTTIGNDRRGPYKDEASLLGRSGFAPARARPGWIEAPTPEDWAGLTGRIDMPVVLQPDLAVALAESGREMHSVFLLVAELTGDADTPAPVERLVQGLTAWALCSGIEGMSPGEMGTLLVSRETLDELALKLSAPDATGPDHDQIMGFMAAAFTASAEVPQNSPTRKRDGVVLPILESLKVTLIEQASGTSRSIQFADYAFVDDDYRNLVDEATRLFILAQSTRSGTRARFKSEYQTLTSVLFEEWVQLIMRAGAVWLAQHLRRADDAAALQAAEGSDPAPLNITVRELLNALVASSPDADPDKGRLRSPAAEIATMASRFFVYGQRLPAPANGGTIPPWQEPVPEGRESGDQAQAYFHPIFRLAGTQVPLGDADLIRIEPGQYDGWLNVGQGVETDIPDVSKLQEILDDAAAINLPGTLRLGDMFIARDTYIHLGTFGASNVLPDPNGSETRLWMLGPEARQFLDGLDRPPQLAKSDPNAPDSQPFELLLSKEAESFVPAIVIDIVLNRAPEKDTKPGAPVEFATDSFEIKAIPEPLRTLLDPFAPVHDGGDKYAPEIEEVSFYKVLDGGQTHVRIIPTNGEIALLQSNLSVQVKPTSVAIAPREEQEKRISPLATISQGLAFVQLLRQSAIVNTGGYALTYPGAGKDLAPLFATGENTQVPLQEGPRLRLVIRLKSGDKAMPRANALLGGSQDWSASTVFAARSGQVFEPRHEPGVVPFEVIRPPIENLVEGSVQDDLAQRFSSLATELSVRDRDDNPIGITQNLDQAIPVGSDTEDRDCKVEAGAGTLYRFSAAVAQIAGLRQHVARDRVAETNVYSLVGGKVRVRADWRDVYGNAWSDPDEPLKMDMETPIVYADRLLGLTGLPYTRLAYWPDESKPLTLNLALISDFEALIELDRSEEVAMPLPAAWRIGMLEQFGREQAMLSRAIAQLRDERVKLTLESSFGNPVEVNKPCLIEHLEEVIKTIDKVVEILDDNLRTRAEVRSDLINALRDSPPPEVQSVAFTAGTLADFTEFSVNIRVARPDPAKPEGKGLYPTDEMTKLAALPTSGLSETVSLFPGLVEVVEEVPANLRGYVAEPAPEGGVDPAPPEIGFGGTDDLVAALAQVAAQDFHIATGHGEQAVGVDRAIWLIRAGYIDPAMGDGLFDATAPVAFGLPPISNAPHSVSFGDGTTAGLALSDTSDKTAAETRKHTVSDVDADAFALQALDRLEEMISPGFIVPLMEAGEEDKLTPDAMRPILERLHRVKIALAGILADRLMPVFSDDVEPLSNLPDWEARVARLKISVADLLRKDLRTHYRLTSTLAYFDAAERAGTDGDARVAHGTVHFDREVPPGLRAKAFNLRLAPEGENEVWRDLLIAFETVNPESAPTYPDSFRVPKRFDLTHVQRHERPDAASGKVSYRPTSWLQLHQPEPDNPWSAVNLPNPDQRAVVPNPLRQLPMPPIILTEGFSSDYVATNGAGGKNAIAAARKWTSSRSFKWEGNSRDLLTVTMAYGVVGSDLRILETEPFETTLIRFVLETDNVIAGLRAGKATMLDWAVSRAELLIGGDVAPLRDEGAGRAGIITESVVLNERPQENDATRITVSAKRQGEVAQKMTYGSIDTDDPGKAIDITAPTATGILKFPQEEPVFKSRYLDACGLDILEHSMASTEIALTRNETIAVEGEGDSRQLQSQFVYRLPTVASGEPIIPAIDIRETVNGGTLTFDADGNATNMEPVLREVFQEVLSPTGLGARPVRVDATFEYESGLLFGTGGGNNDWREAGGPIIAVPIGLCPSILDGAVPSSGVSGIAGRIETWIRNNVARSGGCPIGSLLADIRVFTEPQPDGGPERNILRLRRCQFAFASE